jgi:hypothetical protein
MNWFTKQCAKLLKKSVTSRSRAQQSHRVRLGIELLEDRVVPSISSPNGQHVADVVSATYAGGTGIYVLEGPNSQSENPVGGPYKNAYLGSGAGSPGGVGFSPDSQHLVWVAEYADSNWGVVEDGKGLGPELPNLYTVGFSSNSQHYAYVGTVYNGLTAYQEVFVDGAGDGLYSNLSTIGFSADSKYFSYEVPTSYGEQIHTIALSGAAVSGTTTMVGASQTSSVFGQPVTFTATVRAGSGTPTGSVTFVIDGQDQAPVQLNASGQASYSLSSLSVGSHTIGAIYGGGTGFNSSQTTSTVTESVAKAGSKTTVGASVNPSVFGQAVTYIATVSAAAPGSGIPSGSVTFVIDGQSQAPVQLNASGQASLTLSSLSVGSHSISATYSGDASFLGSQTATPLTETENPDATTTVLSAAANPSVYGQAVTYTATVSAAAPGSGIPTGFVNFVVDGKAPVQVPLNFAGQASLTVASFSAGTHSINASYLGSANDLASQANATQTVSLALSPAALPADTVGQSYSQQISASGGSGNYSYALVAGALPKGLALSSGGVLSGTTTVAGNYSFTIKATDNSAAGVTGAQVCTLTVNPAPMTVTVGTPSTATAGTSFIATITIKDAYGNNYNGPVSLATSDGEAVSPATFTMANGSTTLALALRTAGTVTLTASAGAIKGSSTITINPAAAVALAVSAPNAVTAGGSFNVTVAAKDAFGNTATGFSGNITLSSTDGQSVLPASLTLGNGTATTAVTLDKADALKLFAGNGVIGGYSGLITVSPAAMTVVVSAPSTATAGVGFSTTITIKDAYGNGYNGLVTLTASDGQALNVPSFTMANGSSTLALVLYKADPVTLTASAGSLKGSCSSITVNPAAAVALAVSAPSTATAGTSFNVTVTAEDAYGNAVKSVNGNVSLSSTDGQSVLPASLTLSNGTATTSVTLDKADALKLFAGNGVIGGYSGLITVSPAAMTVVVSAPSTATAGIGFYTTITIKDAYGNGYNGLVTLTSSDGQALNIPSFTMAYGSSTLALVLYKADPITLTATAGSLKGSSAITVNPAAAAKLAVSSPSAVTAGSSFSVTVTAQDAYGNTVTGFNGNVTLSSTDGQSVLPASLTLSNGTATTAVTLDKTDALKLFAGNGVIGGYSGLITVSAAAMTVVVSAPSTATAGVGFYTTITIKDAYGNGYNGLVTLTSSDGQALNIPSFTMAYGSSTLALVLYKADPITLMATAGSLKGSSAITVNPAAAAKLAVSSPSAVTAGTSFNVTVTAQDAYGNTVTGFNGIVTLSCTDGQSAPVSLTLSNGTANTAVTLDKADSLKLAASNGVIGGYSGLITVSPAAMTVVVSAPSTAKVGVGFYTTITIKDAYGNGYNGLVTLTASDGQKLNVPSFTMANGSSTLLLVLDIADIVSLTATAGSLEESSGLITVVS